MTKKPDIREVLPPEVIELLKDMGIDPDNDIADFEVIKGNTDNFVRQRMTSPETKQRIADAIDHDPDTLVEMGVTDRTQKINSIMYTIMEDPDICPGCRKMIFEALITLNILDFSMTVVLNALENGFVQGNVLREDNTPTKVVAALDEVCGLAEQDKKVMTVAQMVYRMNRTLAEQGSAFHTQQREVLTMLNDMASGFLKNKNTAKPGEIIHAMPYSDIPPSEKPKKPNPKYH